MIYFALTRFVHNDKIYLMTNENEFVYEGIMPMYTRWVHISEDNSVYNGPNAEEMKRYLLEIGFTDATPYILDCISKLIVVVGKSKKFLMYDECATLASGVTSADGLALQIKYYIAKNLDAVRDKLLDRHGIDIGEYFFGAKNFIRKIAMIYSAYGR